MSIMICTKCDTAAAVVNCRIIAIPSEQILEDINLCTTCLIEQDFIHELAVEPVGRAVKAKLRLR